MKKHVKINIPKKPIKRDKEFPESLVLGSKFTPKGFKLAPGERRNTFHEKRDYEEFRKRKTIERKNEFLDIVCKEANEAHKEKRLSQLRNK